MYFRKMVVIGFYRWHDCVQVVYMLDFFLLLWQYVRKRNVNAKATRKALHYGLLFFVRSAHAFTTSHARTRAAIFVITVLIWYTHHR